MKQIRNLLCFVICAATVFLLASCGKKEETKPASSEQTLETTQVNYTEKWVLEPSIEADKIYSLPLCVFNDDTNHYDVSFGSVYIIEKDGKLGFIDSNGKIIIEPKYDTVETCTCTEGYIATVKPEGSYRETYNINLSFEELWSYPHKCEEFDGFIYEWNQQENKAETVREGYKTRNAVMPETVKDSQSGKYALALPGKLAGDYTYDTAGVFTGGLVALSKGGKWGYLDYSGKTVIPFEYDAVEGYGALGITDTAYESSEGYVTVLKDGQYGIFRTDGEQVVPCRYKALTTVCDGRVFALSDNGMWGILEIDKTVSDGITKESESQQETQEPESEFSNEENSSLASVDSDDVSE